MAELNDRQLEDLLRGHLAAELDGQLGRASARSAGPPRGAAGRRIWITALAMAGSALAAGLAVLFVFGRMHDRPGPSSAHPGAAPVAAVPAAAGMPAEREISWNTIDQGTVLLNGNTPMRSIRRQRIDSLRWTDPATNAEYEVLVPHDEIMLVTMQAN